MTGAPAGTHPASVNVRERAETKWRTAQPLRPARAPTRSPPLESRAAGSGSAPVNRQSAAAVACRVARIPRIIWSGPDQSVAPAHRGTLMHIAGGMVEACADCRTQNADLRSPKGSRGIEIMPESAVRERLQQAIGTGELIGIVYHGGSRPGAFREIAPLQIDADKVRARCYTSNAVKVFSLGKIELRGPVPTQDDIQQVWNETAPQHPPYTTIVEVHEYCRATVTELGYTAELETYQDGHRICLRTSFKNGKLRKTAVVSISHERLIWDTAITPTGQFIRTNERPRQRPWIVSSKKLPMARSFSDIAAAVRCFLEQASVCIDAQAEANAPSRPVPHPYGAEGATHDDR